MQVSAVVQVIGAMLQAFVGFVPIVTALPVGQALSSTAGFVPDEGRSSISQIGVGSVAEVKICFIVVGFAKHLFLSEAVTLSPNQFGCVDLHAAMPELADDISAFFVLRTDVAKHLAAVASANAPGARTSS